MTSAGILHQEWPLGLGTCVTASTMLSQAWTHARARVPVSDSTVSPHRKHRGWPWRRPCGCSICYRLEAMRCPVAATPSSDVPQRMACPLVLHAWPMVLLLGEERRIGLDETSRCARGIPLYRDLAAQGRHWCARGLDRSPSGGASASARSRCTSASDWCCAP